MLIETLNNMTLTQSNICNKKFASGNHLQDPIKKVHEEKKNLSASFAKESLRRHIWKNIFHWFIKEKLILSALFVT